MAGRPLGDCGHPVSKAGIKRCRECWRKRGPELEPDQIVRTTYTAKACGHVIPRPGATWCNECFRGSHPAPAPVELALTYDEVQAQFRRFIGCTMSDYRGPASARPASSATSYAIISDLHAPFQHTEAFAAFISDTAGADVCIVAGDLLDHYSISRFLKYESVPVSTEMAAATMILERLSETFPEVRVIEGNHDTARFEKLLADRLPHDAIDIIRYLSKTGRLSTVEALCAQFPNVTHATSKVGKYDVGWFTQVGDAVIAHAEKYSRVVGSTMRGLEEWFTDFEATLGLNEWRVLLQAHTHQLSWFPYRADKILGETGCCCHVHGYQLSARVAGRPQRLGWYRFTQDDGRTRLDDVRPVWFRG